MLEQQALDRNPYLAETSSVASILDLSDGGRIFPISPPQPRFNRESVAFFNASCGPMIERGGLLPAAYRGNAFVCEPLANLVHRRVLEPAGVTFVARRAEQGREFLASSDPAFRPVNLANGPDGALYVVDMYRELVEHPQFVPDRRGGRSTSAAGTTAGGSGGSGRRPRRSDTARRPHLRKADDRTLVALLGNRNAGGGRRRSGCWSSDFRANRARRRPFSASLTRSCGSRRIPCRGSMPCGPWPGSAAVDATHRPPTGRRSESWLREHAIRVAAAVQPGRSAICSRPTS